MGSTAQSTQITPSTWGGYTNSQASLLMQNISSVGGYFEVGDATRYLIFLANGSSTAVGAVFVEPGARWAGSRGQAPSTTIATYTTATAPFAVSVPSNAVSGSSAIASTLGCFMVLGPFESAMIKSSDHKVYIAASTVSTLMYAAVVAFGSTN